jgi:hypothetical protein
MSDNMPGKPLENAHAIDELVPSLPATVAVTSQPHDLEVIVDQLCAPLLAASALTYENIDTALRLLPSAWSITPTCWKRLATSGGRAPDSDQWIA